MADLYYDRRSWEVYEKLLKDKKNGTLSNEDKAEGRAAFLPSPKEIEVRAKQQKWLVKKGLGDIIVHSVMMLDFPSFRLVKFMVGTMGVKEAKVRITQLIRKRKEKR